MKLLVVVDKLLTGFDAPPCTYLYIDKSMQDHGLFQAICRTNRLDGEDKPFGYIVDYKDLFKKVENAISVYTSELDHSGPGPDPEVLLYGRLEKSKEKLDNAVEALAILCEPVLPPKGELQHIHYFCGNTEIPADLAAHEPQRTALYKGVVALVRAYANLSDEMEAAGYSKPDVERIKRQVNHYVDVREFVRRASGEEIDLKAYEADMRHLLDTYIEADESRKISPFDGVGLLDLIVKSGVAAAISGMPSGLRSDKNAVAETIENNVRRKIMQERLNDPAFYEKMSALLDEIIKFRKERADEYEAYLRKAAELAKQVQAGVADDAPDALKASAGLRAIYNNLKARPRAADGDDGAQSSGPELALAMRIDAKVREVRPDAWRGHQAKEQVIKRGLYEVVADEGEVENLFRIIKAQGEY
jgi:type I restriction enzyme R subunit